MITLRPYTRDFDFAPYDYVFEDTKKFEATLPYLMPKLEGRWDICILEPKLPAVRTYLDTSMIPSYLNLVLVIESGQLEQLYLERPQLVEKEKTPWDIYLDLLKEFPTPIERRALRELYFRVGPKEVDLRAALTSLSECDYITVKEINKRYPPMTRVYASQVVRSFLLGKYTQAWRMLSILESEIGNTVAFYAMRKHVRRIFEEKHKYLQNEETREWLAESVDGYTIVLLYWLFETATSPYQLYPILQMFERRIAPCSS